ncbi:MAG: hypothetical protein H0W34_09045 [Pyrinomonadaceae bacterium]|nr:hypothetical protein [Chthoniobacterales bacterium]MBA3572100.1 hypothetical protein [Pyrinomonadaceae bacterium]
MNPKRDELLEAWDEICLERGSLVEVGPEHYRWFVSLNDRGMGGLISLMLLDRRDEFAGWLGAEPQMKSEQDIFDAIETMLFLVARGRCGIREDGKVGYAAVVGPDPTEAETQAIEHRILASRSLFRGAAEEVFQRRFDAAPGSRQ